METNSRCAVLENPAFSPAKAVSLVVEHWTLIGHSSDSAFSIDNAKFIDASDVEYTWANAVSQNKVYAYLAYWDSTAALARNRKYKYTSLSTLGMDDSNLQPKTGYWVYAWEAGKLNLPSVGGTLSGETYPWRQLRFHNGTDELNASDAVSAGFAHSPYYYGWTVVGKGGFWGLKQVNNFNTFISNPWQGYFIKSNYDNITFIRQN